MTQTELDGLLALVLEQARSLRIPVSPHILPRVTVNRRAKSRFGCCRHEGDSCRIEVSSFVLPAGRDTVLEVLAHEILHTCPGCSNHGPLWKSWADRMNRAFGYRIRRTHAREELGVAPASPRWMVVCLRCGRETPRMKRSPVVDHPERYRCTCGGALSVRSVSPPR